jgi:hypothetical protein
MEEKNHFASLSEALRAGYQVYGRTPEGYLVRTRSAAGWVLALAHVAQK